jgi:hypothetical protein
MGPRAVIGFVPEDPRVAVRAETAHTWTVQESYHYGDFTVPSGQATDFASSPRVTAWLVPPYGLYTPSAVMHDTLWRRDVPADRIGYREADQTFLESMRLLGVPFVQRWLMWTGVRWGALLTRRGGHVDWWKDAPLVAVWTVIALPIIALPAVTIAVSLLALAALEALAWVPLAIGRLTRRDKAAAKYVNPPKVTART